MENLKPDPAEFSNRVNSNLWLPAYDDWVNARKDLDEVRGSFILLAPNDPLRKILGVQFPPQSR